MEIQRFDSLNAKIFEWDGTATRGPMRLQMLQFEHMHMNFKCENNSPTVWHFNDFANNNNETPIILKTTIYYKRRVTGDERRMVDEYGHSIFGWDNLISLNK